MTAFVVNRSTCKKIAVGFYIWFCIIGTPRKRNKKLEETIANKGSRPIFYRFGIYSIFINEQIALYDKNQ